MLKVKVKSIPVRYDGTTYQPGEEFSMKAEHVDDSLVEVIGTIEKVTKSLDEMTIPELKDYAAEHGIDLAEAKKRDEILAAIRKQDSEAPDNPVEE